MRTPLGTLGTVVLLGTLVLTACGDEKAGGEADDEPRGPIDFTLVEIVTETNVGGMVSPGAVALTDMTAVQQFTGQFEDADRMQVRLTDEFNDLEVPDDQAAYAAVVAIGCDAPTDVTVTSADSGLLIEQVKPSSKPVQCLAAATSVAIVLVDESVVG